jgi:hypothetical protein
MLPILLLGFADLSLLPPAVTLQGPQAEHRLLVVERDANETTADRTAAASFTSSNPAIVRVDASGNLVAVGDGKATVTAKVGDRTATATVTVQGTKTQHTWSFNQQVQAVLTRHGCNSGACHGALAGKGGLKLSLRGYDPESDYFALTRQALGRRIDREAPEKSLLLLKPTMALTHGGGLRLEATHPDYRVLAEWIAAGAPGPNKTEPAIERLEVFPPVSLLKPGDEVQVLVQAVYADGRREEVTRWAKFVSSEESVATVSESGKVRVIAAGEAAISVLFANRVAPASVVVPFANEVPKEVFQQAVQNNFIDEHVLKKLARLRLPPSPLCSDEEFLRRAYLDAAGILPTEAERDAFLHSRDPDKRDKLIDALLERPEFVDYWAYKWSDLLLITTRRLPQPAVWAFYQFVRQSVADNKPWDRFAREVVTASGSTLKNGAANYFVLHKDVTILTESTAVTFMGMSITCAQCHNHPLERWTQDQYWQLANLFSRVGLKNGERGGEVFVQSQPSGEAYHPRRGVPMPPSPLDGKPLALDSDTDRRAYFADWLTADDNPYFARALVNRVWRNFLGRGLVEAEDDLRETNPATNEQLLNALSRDFVQNKYDVKHLIRTIMRSATYQRSSKPVAGNASDDRFYSRYLARRLSAEVILDAYSQVTGVPTPFTHLDTTAKDAKVAYAGFPRGLRAMQLPDTLVTSPFLDAFGRPDRAQTCSCERSDDASVGQALHLNNGQTLNDKLRDKSSLVNQLLADKVSDAQAVRRLYRAALARDPSDAEVKRFVELMAEAPDRREALEDLFWAVLTSREFLFNR